MKNRKIYRTLLVMSVCLLTACGGTKRKPSETVMEFNETQMSEEKQGEFRKTATLEETVMVDEGGVKITATGLKYNYSDVELEVLIENNTEKDLSFIAGAAGYSCNSVNGYMTNYGYLNCDVSAGKKANDTISFSYSSLMLYGIDEIADLEVGFSISDEEYNHTYTGPRQVKTSAYDSYDYTEDVYKNAINNAAAMSSYGYEVKHFSEETLYEENGVKLLSSGILETDDGEMVLLLEVENTTDSMIYLAASDVAINGLTVSDSIWSVEAVNSGKHVIFDVELSDVLDEAYWEIYGIEEVGSVSVSLTQRNSDGKAITDPVKVEVVNPGVAAEYDFSGEEIYSKEGLRIVSKTIWEDPSEYSTYMYALLLVENNSGKTLTIDEVYDSLSVNGFMTDYSFYSHEIKNGERAVLKIYLLESSLEENKITSASEITEIELDLEIKEGRNEFDNPTIKITY